MLTATVLGSGLAMLDGTVVNVALPRIGEDLGGGLTSLQWTLNAYTLTLSGLLLLGGSLGDRMGRRRIFMVGVLWFTLASIGCALAPSTAVLIGMRALQGAGAALLTPGSLAILQASFRKEDRSTAVGAWSGLGGVATAFGPILGGLLVGVAPWGWRLVFLINIPIAAVVIVLSRRYIPESRDEMATGKLDVSGAILASVGLGGLVYGLTEGPASGWSTVNIAITVAGVALLVVFVILESRKPDPLLPLGLFKVLQFSAANLVTFAVYAALAGALFLLPVQLQLVAGFSPVQAGAATLPITVMMLLLSARMGRLSSRIGPRIPMTIGPIIAGLAMVWLDRVGAGLDLPGRRGRADAAVRARPVVHRRAADLDGARGRTRSPGGHRVGDQQRRRAGGRPAVGGRVAGAGRPDPGGLRGSGAAVRRFPAGRPDRRNHLCGRRRARVRDDPFTAVARAGPADPPADESDPAVECPACPVLTPHIKPR